MSRKAFREDEELGDLGEWKGAVPVRHRWVEHEEPRRHRDTDGDPGERRRKPRRRSEVDERSRREE